MRHARVRTHDPYRIGTQLIAEYRVDFDYKEDLSRDFIASLQNTSTRNSFESKISGFRLRRREKGETGTKVPINLHQEAIEAGASDLRAQMMSFKKLS